MGSIRGSGPLLVVLGIAMVDSPCACSSLRHVAAVMVFFSVGEDKDSNISCAYAILYLGLTTEAKFLTSLCALSLCMTIEFSGFFFSFFFNL